MHISSADKKEKPWFLKALKTRRNPFFDKTVRKTGFIQFGAGGRTRTGTPSLAVDFESTTSTNSITPANMIAHLVYTILNWIARVFPGNSVKAIKKTSGKARLTIRLF